MANPGKGNVQGGEDKAADPGALPGASESGTLFVYSPKPSEPGAKPALNPEEIGNKATLPPETGKSVTAKLKTEQGVRGDVSISGADESLKLLSGRASEDRYHHVGEIARGGMGAIVKLLDNDLRRAVAMKIILGSQDRDMVSRFVEEAQVTGQLEHPNIVPVHELGVSGDGRVYFTMKLVRGESLESILKRLKSGDPSYTKKYGLGDLLEILLKTLDAVAFAHSKGVIHRDLKPENIMVGAFGEVLVMDWGLSKIIGRAETPVADGVATARSQKDDGRTVLGNVIGTPSYMPPEQADGLIDEIDERSDVFALGGILYGMLCLEPPYTGESRINIVAKALKADITPPGQRHPGRRIPAELESVSLKALARNKADRYQSAEAMASDVRAYIEHRLLSAHAYGPVQRFVKLVQRHPAGSLAAAVASLLLLAGAGLSIFFASRLETLDAEARMEEAQRREAEAEAEAESLRAEKAEKEKAAAVKRADAAEDTLRNARLVSAVLRNSAMEIRTVGIRLKESFYSGATPEKKREAGDRLWPRVEEFGKSVPSDSVSQATWLSVKGWLRRHAGYPEEARKLFDESRATDSRVVYGHLFDGMVSFADYLMFTQFPSFGTGKDGFVFHGLPGESARQKELRERFEKSVAAAREAGLWGESSPADFTEAIDGMLGIKSRDLALAQRGLDKAAVIPEMIWIREEILYERSNVRLLRYDFSGALSDIDRVLEVNSKSSWFVYFKAWVLLCTGLYEDSLGKDPTASLRGTIAAYTTAIEINPADLGAYHSRGMAWSSLAGKEEEKGVDPRPFYGNAVSDFTEALKYTTPTAYDHNRAVVFHGRGLAYIGIAKQDEKEGKDAEDLFVNAMSDLADMIHSKVWYTDAKPRFTAGFAEYCKYAIRKGASPEDFLASVAGRYRTRAADPAAGWEGFIDLGVVLDIMGSFDEASAAYAKAAVGYAKDLDRKEKKYLTGHSLSLIQGWAAETKEAAKAPAWRHGMHRARLFIALNELKTALDLFEKSAGEARAAGFPDDDAGRAFIAGVFYDMACAYSLRSAGKGVFNGKADLPAEGEARGSAGRAIASLKAAIDNGWSDFNHIAKDADLDPVRNLQGFKELVAGKGGK